LEASRARSARKEKKRKGSPILAGGRGEKKNEGERSSFTSVRGGKKGGGRPKLTFSLRKIRKDAFRSKGDTTDSSPLSIKGEMGECERFSTLRRKRE